jgi:hypothetical protein
MCDTLSKFAIDERFAEEITSASRDERELGRGWGRRWFDRRACGGFISW